METYNQLKEINDELNADYDLTLYEALIYLCTVKTLKTYTNAEITEEMLNDILQLTKEAILCYDDINETVWDTISSLQNDYEFETD